MTITKRLMVGRSAYSMGGSVHFHRYAEDNSICIRIMAPDGSLECTATVCIDAAPPAGHVYLKDWGGNQGVPEALHDAGVVVLLDEYQRTGMAVAQLARLTQASLDQIALEVHP